MSQASIETAIRNSYLAQGMSEEQLALIYEIAQSQCFDKGETIVRQFDSQRDLMILASGSADILTVVGEPIGVLQPHMPFGEVSLIDDKPRSATIVASERCEVVILPAEQLLELLQARMDIANRALVNLCRVLCSRLRSANLHLAAMMAIEEATSAAQS